MTDEQLQQLADALGKCKGCQRDMLGKLVKARLIDPADLELLDQACEGDGDELALLLAECEEGGDLDMALGNGLPGDGLDGGRYSATVSPAKAVREAAARQPR